MVAPRAIDTARPAVFPDAREGVVVHRHLDGGKLSGGFDARLHIGRDANVHVLGAALGWPWRMRDLRLQGLLGNERCSAENHGQHDCQLGRRTMHAPPGGNEKGV
jgi:hypothetical protein